MPGLAILGCLGGLVLLSLATLVLAAPGEGVAINLGYVGSIAAFTILQAGLSALLSLGLGALVALALARRQFPGRRLLVALFGVATALPAIVTVFAITAIYGRAGVANVALGLTGLPRLSIYGLTGILIAHVFFNASFATRVYLAGLEAVPGEHWRLAASLGLGPVSVFRLIDRPILLRETPALALLVFIACSVSFAVPLALGGGPGAATLEVAIFEALRFDVDFARAALLALIQIGFMSAIVALAAPLLGRPPEAAAAGRVVERPDRDAWGLRLADAVVITVSVLLVVPPLLSVAWSGRGLLGRLDPALPAALATSLLVAVPSAALALAGAVLIARSRVALAASGHPRLGRLVAIAPLLAIATPPLAFASGLFILARSVGDPARIAVPTLILVNAMMALPFVHRLVEPPLTLAAERYGRLAESLGMGGLGRLRLVEWPLLGPSAGAAFAYAMALSLGDLGVVTLFGSDSLVTLPALLFAKLGAYRVEDAAGVAAILTALVLGLFVAAERLGRRHARP